MSADGRVRHALFDFGGPLLLSPFELVEVAAPRLGVDPCDLPGGPFDPDDLRWEARRRGEIDERQYWAEVADRFDLDVIGLMRCFYEPSGDHLVRGSSWDLVEELLTAGRRVGLLTNDLTAFHDKWLRPDNATIFVAGDMYGGVQPAIAEPASRLGGL